MKPEQRPIVKWMTAQIRRLGISPERWAKNAGLHPTTVTRAVSDKYESVTSIPTLVSLARAAGVSTVLDFLESQSETQPLSSASPRAMQTILAAVLPEAGIDRPSDKALQQTSEALAYGLALLASAGDQNDSALRVAAQAAAERVRTR